MTRQARRRTLILLALAAPFAGSAFSAPAKRKVKMVKLHTNFGPLTLELDAKAAPDTVANFLQYARDGHYDGTIFHRVIDGFMIQGGGFTANMEQKATRAPVQNEAQNGLKNAAYTVAMARTPNPHSATAQFFINVADNAFLDYRSPDAQGYGYCVFGRVVEGKDVVDRIRKVRTGMRAGHQDVPVEDVVIERAEIVEG
jgi:peptidyl-prolyl cis-trans isomerase B (cyclophilin B)